MAEITYNCGSINDLKKLKVPKLKKDKSSGAWDWYGFGEKVCKFLKKLKTEHKDRKILKGNYDKLLDQVSKLCKKAGASFENPGMFLFMHGNLGGIIKACEKYKNCGKDVERVKQVSELIINLKRANTSSVDDITSAGMNGNRTFKDLDSDVYAEITIREKLAEQFQNNDAKYKFVGNKHLEKVIITGDVKKICAGSFINCKKLTTIVVDNRTDTLRFETGAIVKCSKFKEITGDIQHVEYENDAIQNCTLWKKHQK